MARPTVGLMVWCCLAVLFGGCAGRDYRRPSPTGTKPESPTGPDEVPAGRGEALVYTVRSGDTLYAIARAHGTTVADIQAANRVGTLIRPGQRLEIPSAGQPAAVPASEPRTEEPAAPLDTVHSPPEAPTPPPPERLHRGKPSNRFWWPCDAASVSTSLWESRGVVMRVTAGSAVVAASGGRVTGVVAAGRAPQDSWGSVVIIRHAGGYTSWYAHLSRPLVGTGQWVAQGTAIGVAGTTGRVTEPSVAFRVFDAKDRPVNPIPLLP